MQFIYTYRVLTRKEEELKGYLSTRWCYKSDMKRFSQKLVFIWKEWGSEAIRQITPSAKKTKPNQTKQLPHRLLDSTSVIIW